MLGHVCRIPPTGANIAVLVSKTELTVGSSYNQQLAVVGLGVGMMLVWVPYYCSAAVSCLSLPLLLLLLFCVCLRALVCSVIVEARRSVTPAGCCPPAPTLCAIIEDLACSGFNLYLAAFSSWVQRWDDGGSCAALLCRAELCCCCRSCWLCMLPPRSPKTFFCCQKGLQNLTNYKIKYVLGKKSAQVLILGKPYNTLVVTSKIKPYRVYVVWVLVII